MTQPQPGEGAGGAAGSGTQTLPPPHDRTPQPPPSGPTHRFWSARRLPSAIVAFVCLVASGALLFDTAAVRADHPAGRWRRWIADQLAERPLDDPWVLGAAGLAVILGLWLIWLTATPGLRAVLPLRTPSPYMRAGIDRKAAALVLRDSALQVAGVSAARVTVGRRRVKALVDVNFRDIDEVHEELRAVLEEDLERMRTARPLRLSLTARRIQGK
ncbi:DUF6286 domain-containing protein [Wenjunlia tyrosinilytica]|uniref:DUF6286 domain-containing protein n=1 Tax=Wenjunlia tyrosinilytica TaxID=1544741 RepID=A0A917ZG42_9ACTN|nr:DUF6286 domain-containing protein [Wenjunlia tyrosinilytica]GGO81227.1 hypothetical protein GCM10012280_04930 [Wenjunlia tyrosinilytica]